jgi:hypothetical protein
MRGHPKRRLGHGLAAQPSGATGLRGLLQRARAGVVTTCRPRVGRRGGVLAGGSAVARRRQGVARDLEGVTGKVPGKEERAGAHRNGWSTVRRCKRRRAAAFISGDGAPVVAGGGDEALQLGRGEGVRDLQEISGIGSSGRSSPGSGGRRRCSVGIREGEGVAGGRRRRSECGERLGGSGAREEGSERSGDDWSSVSGERAARRQRDIGERGKRWGSRAWGCHTTRGCRGVWPRPADGRCVPRALVPAGQSEGERRLTGGPRHSFGRRCH